MNDPAPIDQERILADREILQDLGGTKFLADALVCGDAEFALYRSDQEKFNLFLDLARQLCHRSGDAYQSLRSYLARRLPGTTADQKMLAAFDTTILAATKRLADIHAFLRRFMEPSPN